MLKETKIVKVTDILRLWACICTRYMLYWRAAHKVRSVTIIFSMKVELIEKAVEIVGDNQLLVNIVSKRVQQLNHGADPYVVTTPDMQCGDIALTEIIEGKLVWREQTDEEQTASSGTKELDPFEALTQEAGEPPVVEATVTL